MNIHVILQEIDAAYPEYIFPDTTKERRDEIAEKYPGFIDCTSAMMGRHLASVIRRKLAELPEEEDEIEMTDADRADHLEAMVDRMAEKLSECALLVRPMYDLCQQIEICGASEELTKAVTMAGDIMHKLMDTLGIKQLDQIVCDRCGYMAKYPVCTKCGNAIPKPPNY